MGEDDSDYSLLDDLISGRSHEEKEVAITLEADLTQLHEFSRTLVGRLVSIPPSEAIYHYTTPEGLLGIVATNSIWATSARYLNDSSELDYVEKVLARTARHVATATWLMRDGRETANYIAEGVHRVDFPGSIYVASFSEDSDVLSQWRAYAGDGGGYAIGFDWTNLPSAGGDWPAPSLMKVVYDEDEQDAVVGEILSRALRLLDKYVTGRPKQREAAISLIRKELNSCLSEVLPALKNPGFREENEWRLVAWDQTATTYRSPVGFRKSSFGLTPHLALQWPAPPPIKKLVLGPRLNSREAQGAANQFLHASGFHVSTDFDDLWPGADATNIVKVEHSQVSYRPRSEG